MEENMEIKVKIAKDEEPFVRDEFSLFLAKRALMKKLIEMEMAEKLAAGSQLNENGVDELSELVKKDLYSKVKSLH